MKEQLEIQLQRRVKMLYRYTNAMESGDTDTIAVALEEAQHDSVLERMILEVNEVYQIEDRTVAHPDDVVAAQEMLLATFTENINDASSQDISDDFVDENNVIEVDPTIAHIHAPTTVGAEMNGAASARILPRRKWYRSRTGWLAGAVAAVLIALLVLPGTGALADQFLALFRIQQFQPVQTVERPEQLVNNVSSLLRNFGAVQWNNAINQPLISNSSNLADAQKALSFQPQVPTSLPDGVGHVAQFSTSSSEDVTFVFNRDTTEAYLQKTGQSGVTIPASLTGAKFDVKLNNGFAVVYYDHCPASTSTQSETQKCTSGKNNLAIGEIPSPTISAVGSATFSDLRSFLLSLPKLSPDLHNLVAQSDVNSGVIPVPIPSQGNAQHVTVNGVQGLLLSYSSASLIVWQNHGLVYLITAYGADKDQLLTTANSFR